MTIFIMKCDEMLHIIYSSKYKIVELDGIWYLTYTYSNGRTIDIINLLKVTWIRNYKAEKLGGCKTKHLK